MFADAARILREREREREKERGREKERERRVNIAQFHRSEFSIS